MYQAFQQNAHNVLLAHSVIQVAKVTCSSFERFDPEQKLGWILERHLFKGVPHCTLHGFTLPTAVCE
jgi:hypothetical protein